MSTTPKEFRIFVRGRGTHVFYTAETTQVESPAGPFVTRIGRITKQGRGRFLARTFPTLNEAQAFCRVELPKDKTAIFDIMRGDQILETFLDSECQRVRELVISVTQGLLSAIPIWFGATLLLKKASFLSPTASLVVAAAAVLLYLLILWSNNWGILESYWAMVIVFLLAWLLIPALNKAHHRRERRNAPPALFPQSMAARAEQSKMASS